MRRLRALVIWLSRPRYVNGVRCEVRHSPVKRVFDICFSLGAMLFFAPTLVAVALAVKWSSPGPIFYKQWRIGRGGRRFLFYKFRTMVVDADERLEKILAASPELRAEWEIHHKLKKDPRVTPVGRFLRRCCLDELPQFWNVLRGDLSVVGPRALVSKEVNYRLGKRAAKILSIRPGLTGIWQTSGRSDLSYQRRIALDEHYVDQRNFAMDLRLIARTIPLMITAKGAY